MSMANTGQKDSGGSQFFINVAHNAFLDHFSEGASAHPVFGKCVSAADLSVLTGIVNVATTNDNPNTPIMVESVVISGL
jgi:cyclophilin family peptidyl-prolyl cis-trans isomerase